MIADAVFYHKSEKVRRLDCSGFIFFTIISQIILLSSFIESIYATDCMPYYKIDDNDLTINDIVIKGTETDLACVKARFALAFKISEKQPVTSSNQTSSRINNDNILIGYVRIGNALRSEHNCPKDDNYNTTSTGSKTFLMVVEFECGSLEFKFERDDLKYSLAGISGTIRFGSCKLT